jgi:hypothetical protein
MKKVCSWPWIAAVLLFASFAFAQDDASNALVKEFRHPAASAEASPATAPRPDGVYFSILNGLPMLLALHHDTEKATGNPIDVYDFVIEMQVMNSDGNFEPVGLQFHNYYTAKPLDAKNDVNPNNARDCKFWNTIVLNELAAIHGQPKHWPFIELVTAKGARVIQTNEDGPVWWSDDIECWGSKDRFPPF